MNKILQRKYVNGRFITKTLWESSPEELRSAMKEEIWTTKDGRKILVRQMETRHIVNAINNLKLRAASAIRNLKLETEPHEYALQTNPQYVVLFAELRKRLEQTHGAKTEEKPQPGRKFDFK